MRSFSDRSSHDPVMLERTQSAIMMIVSQVLRAAVYSLLCDRRFKDALTLITKCQEGNIFHGCETSAAPGASGAADTASKHDAALLMYQADAELCLQRTPEHVAQTCEKGTQILGAPFAWSSVAQQSDV